VPAGSKTDSLLANAKPISNGGSTSAITYLRRGGENTAQFKSERGVRICQRTNSADTEVCEGSGGAAPGTGAEIPLQPVEKTVGRQAVPLQSMEVHGGADIHLQNIPHGRDPTPEQVDA